jgi:hypothetical protein
MNGRVLAAIKCLGPLAALGTLSCTELNARWNDHQVFFGTVRESATGEVLTNFCAETTIEHSEAIVFSALPGTTVEEELFIEGRTEKYTGAVPPDRDEAFWCTDVPQVYLRRVSPWICLRAADDDPPVTILAVEPRGEMGARDSSSGYALELQVQRAGVLRVVLDAECVSERSDPLVDAGAPIPHGELTVR